MSTIAFIGLGNMGVPMAANLAKHGETVRGFDVVDEARARAKELGIEVFETAEEAAKGAELVFTSLPNGGLVKKVIVSLLEADPTPKIYIDLSTIAVAEAQEVANLIAKAGSRFLDAPVSGGITGAQAGTLALMVGGPEDLFNEVKPILHHIGKSVTHTGDTSTGQAVKACNNMILAIQQIAVAEALVLGQRLGLSPQAFFDVVSNATGNSWSLSVNAPVPDIVPTSPANNDFKPGFAAALMLKDLKLAMAAADQTGTDTVLGRIATEQFTDFVDEGHGGLDFSAIIKAVEGRKA